MQMVLHSSNSGTKLDKYILNLYNTIIKVLKKKQERQHDELTEIQTFPEEAGSVLLYNRTFRLEGISGGHLINHLLKVRLTEV